jgi:NitT/TauT family transport system substrate-binding protein
VSCGGAPRSAALRTVRLAVFQDPITFLPVRGAQTLGYYAEEGLVVETSEVRGGAKAGQALVGGSVDVAAAASVDAVQLTVEGRDVRGLLLLYTRPTADKHVRRIVVAEVRVRDGSLP